MFVAPLFPRLLCTKCHSEISSAGSADTDVDVLRELAAMSELRRVLRGTGLDLRDDDGVPAGLFRPRTEPATLLVRPRPTGVAAPLPAPGPAAAAGGASLRTRRILTRSHPRHVASYAARSRSSRRRSNAARYRS